MHPDIVVCNGRDHVGVGLQQLLHAASGDAVNVGQQLGAADQLGVALRCAVSLGDFVEGLDDPVAVKDVYKGRRGSGVCAR